MARLTALAALFLCLLPVQGGAEPGWTVIDTVTGPAVVVRVRR